MNKFKETIRTFISYIDTKGFSALASIGICVCLLIFGHTFFGGIAFGVFLTRNWSILREIISDQIIRFKQDK